MRETLEAVAAGELSVAEAEARLAGYATTAAGRYDADREQRRGIPEAILGEGKTSAETAALATTALETTGHALVTRVDEETATQLRTILDDEWPDAVVEHDERSKTVTVHASSYDPPSLDATVAVVTAGTSDAPIAGEAALVAREIGASVELVEDVGVASIVRILDQVDRIRDADVVVVAAGREGALPTVVAGLVDAPVIGLPVSTGYGHGGEGAAALAGLLQSCTVLSVVNIDAGFVAGAQAGLIARTIAAARTDADQDEDDREPAQSDVS